MHKTIPLLMSVVLLPSVVCAADIDEEIIVTARGRAEQAANVPDTLTVFTAQALNLREARTIDDIVALTPGVFMVNDQDPGTNIITVRGVSTDRLQAPSIAYVIDGVPLADTEFFTARPFDVERLEILKGPQGALYGKNAIGGVFNLTTRAPTGVLSGHATVGYGNGESFMAEGGVGGPLAGGKVKFRLSGAYFDSDGFITNTFLNKRVDSGTSRNIRLRLESPLSDSVTVELRAQYMNEEGGAAYISSNNVTGLFGGRLAGAALTDPMGDFEGMADRHWASLSTRLHWTPAFGGTLSLTAAYDDYAKDFVEELDFRNDTPITFGGVAVFPDGIQPISQPKDITVRTAEVRYTSPDETRFRWIIGAFAQDVTNKRVDDFGPLLFGAEAPHFRTASTQTAVYGQLQFDITEALELTAALRYDRDDRRVTVTGVDSAMLIEQRKKVFDRATPKVSLAYRVTTDHLLYATYAEGFKTGGFNPPPEPGDIHQSLFSPERTKAWEAGAKTAWIGGKLVLDAAVFKTDYTNFQHFAFINGLDLALNVDKVKIWGVELSGLAQITDGLSVDAAYAYTDAEIDDFTAPNPVTLAAVNYAGNRTPNAPRTMLNAGASYRLPLSNGAALVARGDYIRAGRIHFEIDNVLTSPARDQVDARLAYETEHWTLALWGKNLTDNRWAISAFGQGQVGLLAFLGPDGPFDSFTINRGRQYGVTLSGRF